MTVSGDKAMVYTARGGDGTTKTVTPGGGINGMHVDRKMTMAAFADFLGRFVDRPVVDMTGLTATYQVVMDIPVDELMKMARLNGKNIVIVNGGGANPLAAGGGDTASDPSDNSAMLNNLQQLGLKLEQRKTPLDMIVVDHAEKSPTEN